MRRDSFSIRGLMIVIVILALAFTGLRTPSRIWANAWFTLALLGVTIAIPAAVASVGDRRAFWVGFAVCGWVYFVFTLAPWVDKEASHQLLTTTILDVASSYIVDNQYLIKNALAVQAINQGIPAPTPTPWQDWNLPELPAARDLGPGLCAAAQLLPLPADRSLGLLPPDRGRRGRDLPLSPRLTPAFSRRLHRDADLCQGGLTAKSALPESSTYPARSLSLADSRPKTMK